MAISDNNKKFLDGLVEYYIDESKSYKQFASEYTEFSESEMDVAFGMIVGTIYGTFLQTYANQELDVGLDDMQEFHEFIKANATQIKESLEKKESE